MAHEYPTSHCGSGAAIVGAARKASNAMKMTGLVGRIFGSGWGDDQESKLIKSKERDIKNFDKIFFQS